MHGAQYGGVSCVGKRSCFKDVCRAAVAGRIHTILLRRALCSDGRASLLPQTRVRVQPPRAGPTTTPLRRRVSVVVRGIL